MNRVQQWCKTAIRSSLAITMSIGVLNHAYAAAEGVQLTVLGGGAIVKFNKNGHITFPPAYFEADTFKNNSNKISATVGGGIAYDKLIQSSQYNKFNVFHDISLGVNYYYTQPMRSGPVLAYGLPDFHNSNYQMKVQTGRLMLDTEWGFTPIYTVIPFVQGGVGVAKNRMTFKNVPNEASGALFGAYELPANSKVQFAYEIGAGVKVPVTNNFIISGRYLYANAGNAESSLYDPASGVALDKPIKTKVQSQSVLLGLSYLFG